MARTAEHGTDSELSRRTSATDSWRPNLAALATVLAVLRLILVIAVPYDQAVALFEDDAFYYFGIARNLAGGAGSTFNGLDATNGYHPLWQLVLVPVFALATGRGALIGVTVVSGALFMASAVLLDRLGRAIDRPLLVTVGAAPFVVLGVIGPTFWFSGMETGLLLMLLLAVAVVFVRSDGLRSSWFDVRHAAGLGVLLGCAVLARLDVVFPMLLFGALAVVSWRDRGARTLLRLTVALATPPALLLAGYLAVNQRLFGAPLPVSGQAKALGVEPWGAGPDGALNIDVLAQFLAEPKVFSQQTWLGALAVLAVPLAVVVARQGTGLVHTARFALVMLSGGLLTACYYAVTSSWMLWPWYFYTTPLALALAAPALLDRLPPTRSGLRLTVLVCVGAVALTGANAVRLAGRDATNATFVQLGPEVAARLDELAPEGAPLAMGDRAGSVGFHLHRPLVHLEGLVNSAEYLDALRAGRVAEFLAAREVRFYARADDEPGQPTRTGCRAFREPQQGEGPKVPIVVCDADLVLRFPIADGTTYRVWYYRADLNLGRQARDMPFIKDAAPAGTADR